MKLQRPSVILSAVALALVMVSPAVGQGQTTPDDPNRGVGAEERPPADDVQESRFDGGPGADDQVILDDLIVDGSICVGTDCVNGESFGFDTLRLKENNLRIKAQDTSSTASFPTQDWQITFNDSSNGGQNKFSIDAIAPSVGTPFTIEASNQNHALYIDDGGRIGFGTSTPVVELHVKDGDTPTLRLEQDGSSGFTQQTWDVAGNEAGFFIRDATNGSTLPLRIRTAAPSSSIDIAGTTGNVGLGETSPDEELHITDSNSPRIKLEDPDNANTVWTIGHSSTGDLIFIDDDGVQFRFYPDGRLRSTPVTAAPVAGVSDGDIYVDDAGNGTLCFRANGAWVVVAGTGPCA